MSPGERIGSYEILGTIGSGGMGTVYRAHDSRLDRPVAIKLLSGVADAERLRRFEQEARAASALDHPNIITIHEVGETEDGTPFIVMQLVEGKSLVDIDGIAVSPDGMWVYYDQRVLRGNDIMLVENFAP